ITILSLVCALDDNNPISTNMKIRNTLFIILLLLSPFKQGFFTKIHLIPLQWWKHTFLFNAAFTLFTKIIFIYVNYEEINDNFFRVT
ncbi:MAG: hypothetical protein WC446_04655, partial [Candidatus Paceibacterota bacterium]